MPIKSVTTTSTGSLLSRGAWIEISAPFFVLDDFLSLLSRGAWIEIDFRAYNCQVLGRSSHEERGLKSPAKWPLFWFALSLLSRGAWIEIAHKLPLSVLRLRRSSHEERGLKWIYS